MPKPASLPTHFHCSICEFPVSPYTKSYRSKVKLHSKIMFAPCVLPLSLVLVLLSLGVALREPNSEENSILTLKSASSAAAPCSFSHEFTASGERAILQSPNYPDDYPNNADCRYTIYSPPGTAISINCEDFNVEPSQNCIYDVFFMSLSGDENFADQEFFCGQGVLNRVSKKNKLAIGFHSDAMNPNSLNPFRYQCTLTVVGTVVPDCKCGARNGVK